jgi:hypothetical protein
MVVTRGSGEGSMGSCCGMDTEMQFCKMQRVLVIVHEWEQSSFAFVVTMVEPRWTLVFGLGQDKGGVVVTSIRTRSLQLVWCWCWHGLWTLLSQMRATQQYWLSV